MLYQCFRLQIRSRLGLRLAVLVLILCSLPAWARAQLTAVDYTGQADGTGTYHQAFTSPAAWNPNGVPNAANYLADVTGVVPTTGGNSNKSVTIAGTNAAPNNTFTLGALAFDTTGASSTVTLNAVDGSGTITAETLVLAGGNTGTTAGVSNGVSVPTTAQNDLLTLTSNFQGTLDMQGDEGGLAINVSVAGNFDISPTSTVIFDDVADSSSSTGTYSTTLAGNGTITLTGGGTLSLQYANPAFTGAFIVSTGTLVFNANNGLGSISSNVSIVDGTLKATVAASPGSTHLFSVNASDSKFSVGGNNWYGIYTLAGTGSLNKIGTGTLSISHASTYSGATNITGGALYLMNTGGDGVGAGAVTVGDGSTNAGILGGSGIVTSPVTVNSNGTLSPGTISPSGNTYAVSGPGTLTINKTTLTVETGATLTEQIGATSNDVVALTGISSANGTLTFGAGSGGDVTVNIQLINAGGSFLPGNQYILFSIGTNVNKNYTFKDLTFVVNAGTSGFNVSQASVIQTGGNIVLTDAPEPTAAAIACTTGFVLLVRRRTRPRARKLHLLSVSKRTA